MRSLLGGAVLLVAGMASACAALSGLDGYQGSAGDGGPVGTGEGGQVTPPGDDVSADDTPVTPGDDAPIEPLEAGEDPDGWVASTDSSAVGDAHYLCTGSTCNGCCDGSGVCHPGSSETSCGKAGSACVDCTSHGGACNAGACGAPTHDASTSTQCNVSSCMPCSGGTFIYAACCTSKNTCGCTFPFAPCG